MQSWRHHTLFFLALAIAASCSISDDDRCPAGYTYDPTVKACHTLPDAATVAKDTAVTPATPDDGGAEDVEGATFGSPCQGAAECMSATTDYCVALPGSAGGYCSKSQCTAECPTDYRCCNCAAFGLVVCLKAQDATQATAAYGCSCS
jgi:hypothetical protein